MSWLKNKILSIDKYRVFNIVTAEFSYRQETSSFYQIEAADWVNVISIYNDCVVMIKQYRIGIEDYTLELPGGLVDADETYCNAAIRELQEETGYTGNAKLIGKMHPNPALFTNTLYSILVEEAQHNGNISREIFEDIDIQLVPLHLIKTKIAQGEITNALTIATFMHYFSL